MGKRLKEALEVWDNLGDICVDEDSCIDTPFLHFPIGTLNTDIWLWIEEEFNVSVAIDLLNLN